MKCVTVAYPNAGLQLRERPNSDTETAMRRYLVVCNGWTGSMIVFMKSTIGLTEGEPSSARPLRLAARCLSSRRS
jgi:hypothetical protein